MNVFEDLIEELKEENLLEETVINLNRNEPTVSAGLEFTSEAAPSVANHKRSTPSGYQSAEGEITDTSHAIHETASPVDEREFFRKRAMEEVSSLQMVEHVISGVEREHMKLSPNSFDDLAVKKALHRFLQLTSDPEAEYSESETMLMQEAQNWFSALARRDSEISVANIRRFCENSRPVLSSQALMALARFYRNSLYSEPVRGKFDFVITRLFSREMGEEKRKLLFGRLEMIGHIKNLYSNWSSLTLFPESDDSEGIKAAVEKFNEFVAEAESAGSFDSLISSDFFNRIRLYKEETNEMFMAPDVTAAAIECNIRIGNRFVELLRTEREANNAGSVEAKYGYTYDTVISSAASKTLLLVELLKEEEKGRESVQVEYEEPPEKVPVRVEFERAPVDESAGFRLFAINKWLAIVTVLILIATAGVYVWSENAVENQGEVALASTVELSDPALRQHLRLARTSEETLYGVTQPSWDAQSPDEQKELLRKAYEFAQTIKMKRVNILNNKGRTVGYASAERLEIFGPQ